MTPPVYAEWAAARRREPGAGLSDSARVAAAIALALDDLHTRAVRQRVLGDARLRRDLWEQFRARLEGL